MMPSNSDPTHAYTYTIRPAMSSDLSYLPSIESSAGRLFKSISGLEHLADDQPMSERTHRESLDKWRGGPLHRDGQDGGTWVAVASDVGGTSEHPDRDQSNQRDVIGNGTPVGFIVTEVLPVLRVNGINKGGNAEGYFIHINELSISTDHQRRGLARRLLRTAKEFACLLNGDTTIDSSSGGDQDDNLRVRGLSLTTFRDVPFNRPFYEKFGFRIVENDEEVMDLCGVEGMRIWREDRERFEGGDGVDKGKVWRRCWMVCDL